MPLLTKTQLKDYEPGEFSDRKQRTFSETRDLIEQFPWSGQRDHFAVGLTCPSITIEGPSGDYLKVALYYNDKFILYYLDAKNHLWTHPVLTIAEACPIIQSFFENSFNLTIFKRQSTPLTNNRIHFETKDFHYTMHGRFIVFMVCISALICTVYPLITILAALAKSPSLPMAGLLVLSILSLLFMACGAFLLALCINHYRASKNKVLSISRGNSLFYYGNIGALAAYDKSNIQTIIQYGGMRSNDRLTRTEIIFRDGSSINVSGLILPSDRMVAKFPHQQYSQRSFAWRYFIPPAASALS